MAGLGSDGPVVERAHLFISDGNADAFEQAYQEAVTVLQASPGCQGAVLHRGVENPGTYLLIVGWARLEAHTVGFRQSEAFGRWRALLQDHFAAPPEVEHFRVV